MAGMENQVEKQMENRMTTAVYRRFIYLAQLCLDVQLRFSVSLSGFRFRA